MKSLKKLLVAVAALAVAASVGAVAVSAAVPDDTLWNANLTGSSPMTGGNVLGLYSGGAAYCYLDNGSLVFDASASGGYCTADLGDVSKVPLDATNNPKYHYALVTMKADNPSAAQGIHLTFGRDAKDGQLGKSLTDWGITLTTSYKTYVVDLTAGGFDHWAAAGQPDFALNQGEATSGKLEIKSIVLSNSNGESVSSSSSATSTSSAAASSGTSSVANAGTGDTFPVAAVALVTLASAAALFALGRKTTKHGDR